MEKESIQSQGGKARAESLTPEERSKIASEAAAARWNIPRATHSGKIDVGGMELPCSVLSDKTRILTQSDFMKGMNMYYSGWVSKQKAKSVETADIPHFLAFKSLKPYLDRHLGDLQTISVKFITEKGNIALGIRAEIIPKICEVWLDADEEGKLGRRQKIIAQKAKIIMRALAHVGIIALVDEATGYQKDRDRLALQQILERFISIELLKWAKRFPDEFYQEMFRLKGWKWRGMSVNRPSVVGKYTEDLVYNRMHPDLVRELKKLNPKDEKVIADLNIINGSHPILVILG